MTFGSGETELESFKVKRISDYDFDHVGLILPKCDEKGEILEYSYQLPTGVRPNKNARGPFCKLLPISTRKEAGVYVITVLDNPVYVGECENLSRTFGPAGYGYISERNCYFDGQTTTCRINSRFLQEYKKGNTINLWFFRSSDRISVKQNIIHKISPEWNGAKTEFLNG